VDVKTVIVSGAVGVVSGAITAYVTTKLKMREEKAKWEREFAVKYAEIKTSHPESAENLATQFAVGYLIVEEPRKDRRKFFIASGTRIIVGRSSDGDILVSDPAVSRRHVMFEAESNSVFVLDLQAVSGVFLNGDKIRSKSKLKSGDVVRVGQTNLTFHST